MTALSVLSALRRTGIFAVLRRSGGAIAAYLPGLRRDVNRCQQKDKGQKIEISLHANLRRECLYDLYTDASIESANLDLECAAAPGTASLFIH